MARKYKIQKTVFYFSFLTKNKFLIKRKKEVMITSLIFKN